jgi:membrane protein
VAELRDIYPVIVCRAGPLGFARKVWREIGEDNLFTWASALAYSWLFAVFPFFLVLLTIIPLLKREWREEAVQEINLAIDQLPRDAKETVHAYVQPRIEAFLLNQEDHRTGIKSLLSVGLLLAVYAASGGMAMTMSAMDRAFDVERARPFYKQRPLAFVLTIVVATLVIAVIVLIPVGTVVTNYLTSGTEKLLEATKLSKPADPAETPREAASIEPPGGKSAAATMPVRATVAAAQPARFTLFLVLWQVLRHLLALMFLVWVVALVYHYGPNVKQRFRLLTPGVVFTVAVWIVLGFTFRFYVDRFGKYGQTYGAVGGVIILLFFFYLDALVLLIGAEINSEIDAAKRAMHHEKMKPPPPEEVVDTQPAVETP